MDEPDTGLESQLRQPHKIAQRWEDDPAEGPPEAENFILIDDARGVYEGYQVRLLEPEIAKIKQILGKAVMRDLEHKKEAVRRNSGVKRIGRPVRPRNVGRKRRAATPPGA